jgi:triacylglycerol lipase
MVATAGTATGKLALDDLYWTRIEGLSQPSAWRQAPASPDAQALGLALDCARLSAAVYRDLAVAAKFAAFCGYERLGDADIGSTQVIVVANGDDVVVCYRGTEPNRIEDWVADARFQFVPAAQHELGDGNVHGGFARALEATRNQVEQAIAAQPAKRVVFTGHSLGAALATLHARRWSGSPAASGKQTALVTFGSPRVGDDAFVASFQDAFETKHCERFVNGRDLVTRVPPRSLGFDHIGRVRYFDDRGALQANGAEWFRWLADIVDASTDFKAAAGRTIADHGMERYVARLEAAFALVLDP